MKKNAPLIIALALPIVFIALLVLVILIPTSKIKPAHDFVYMNWNEYNEHYDATYSGVIKFEHRYELQDGKLVRVQIPRQSDEKLEYVKYQDAPVLYYYDMSEHTIREISYEEALEFDYDAGPQSPDGYMVKRDYGSNGLLDIFGSSMSAGYVVSKDGIQKRLEGIKNDEDYYSPYDFRLIGWIK